MNKTKLLVPFSLFSAVVSFDLSILTWAFWPEHFECKVAFTLKSFFLFAKTSKHILVHQGFKTMSISSVSRAFLVIQKFESNMLFRDWSLFTSTRLLSIAGGQVNWWITEHSVSMIVKKKKNVLKRLARAGGLPPDSMGSRRSSLQLPSTLVPSYSSSRCLLKIQVSRRLTVCQKKCPESFVFLVVWFTC